MEKILIVGMPKSGTSVLTYIIAGAFVNSKVYFEPSGVNNLCDIEIHSKICSEPEITITKCLFLNRKKTRLDEIESLYNKRIWIIRDPRDWLVSNFLYIWYHKHGLDELRFRTTLDMVREKERDPSSVDFVALLENANGLAAYLRRLQNFSDLMFTRVNWHLTRYEDFIKGQTSTLETYLDKTLDHNIELPSSIKRVARTKGSGDWRNWFTGNDIRKLKPVLNDTLSKFGYGSDWSVGKYQYLDPSLGSKYMEGLFYK